MPRYNHKKKISKRFCRECDKWFQPTSKYNFYCAKCVKSRRNPHKPTMKQSEKLKDFYSKYKLK